MNGDRQDDGYTSKRHRYANNFNEANKIGMQIDRQEKNLSGNVEPLLIDESLDAFSKLEEINEIFDGMEQGKTLVYW